MAVKADFHPVLLLEGSPGEFNDVARRIRLQGAEPLMAEGIDDAVSLLPEGDLELSAVLVSPTLAIRGFKKELGRLRAAVGGRELFFLAIGDPPTKSQRKQLRAAGVRLALWHPFDDTTLRFQLNRAWNGNRDDHKRAAPRIPTYLLAQIGGGQRTKDGVVYSLSTTGAFIETARASMAGATLDLAISLPGCFIRVGARVAFANVPGNLERPNLPLGMGVRFEDLDAATQKQLKSYVKKRLAELEV
jgi:hypothetical protein